MSILDSAGQKINEVSDYPFATEIQDVSEQALALVFQSKLVANRSTGQVGIFSMASPNWDIATIANGQLTESRSTHLAIPKVVDQSTANGKEIKNRIAFSTKNKEGFIDVASTEKHIFALYSGKSYEEVREDITFSNTLLVLNWKGNLISRIRLDRKAKAISISDDQQLYALIENERSASIRRFDLSEILK